LRSAEWAVRGIALDGSGDLLPGDVSEPGTWQDACADADLVIHAAALVAMPAPRDRRRFWRVNTLGTRNVIEAARRHGVGRVVLVSSVTVFGNDFPDQVDETYPVRPTGVPYADTKIAAEQVALAAHQAGEVEVSVVRPSDVYGPGSVWITQPLDMMRWRTFALPARGRGIFSPVHVEDLSAGVIAAGITPGAAGHVITLSGGVGVSTADFFDRVAALGGLPRPPRLPTAAMLTASVAAGAGARLRGRQTRLSMDAVRYLAERRGTYSNAKATGLLGWTPTIGLDEGMARLGRPVGESRSA
jgi:nucleoside-diphosphate-sugar epimerase